MSADEEKVIDLSRSQLFVSPAVLMRLLYVLATIGIAGLGLGIKVALFAHDSVVLLNGRFDKLEARTNDRWSLSMQRKYTDDLARSNPMLAVPDPDGIALKLQIR